MTEPLSGKKAIVTAGASGIGLEVARACLKAGAAVAVCDVDQSRLDALPRTDPGIRAYHCNVGNAEPVSRFIHAAADSLGGIDILVNNAGTAGPTAPVEARVIGEHGSDAHDHRLVLGAEQSRVTPQKRRGDPLGLSRAGRDAPVINSATSSSS